MILNISSNHIEYRVSVAKLVQMTKNPLTIDFFKAWQFYLLFSQKKSVSASWLNKKILFSFTLVLSLIYSVSKLSLMLVTF